MYMYMIYTYICTHMYICRYVYVCTCISICYLHCLHGTHIHMYIRLYTYVYRCIHIRTYKYRHTLRCLCICMFLNQGTFEVLASELNMVELGLVVLSGIAVKDCSMF